MRTTSLSRRQFLAKPAALGLPAIGLATLTPQSLFGQDSDDPDSALSAAIEDDGPVPIRNGLGIVIVGGSSGLGAEMARQYARHGAAIVLAARRRDRLNGVAADVVAAGGRAHVIPTDVRHESDCTTMIQSAVAWLASHGRQLDVLALGSYRAQVAPFGPQMSSAVWQNVIATSYFGPAFCLKEALPHLKQSTGTVFYFNSITSSFALPQAVAYTSVKHAWRAVMNAVKAENPELTVVSSHFNAVDTEGFDKELTMFDDDQRYCPSFFKTYVAPAVEMCPAPVAVAKAIRAIERRRPTVFLSLLNKAAWLLGPTHQELSGFLTMLELVARHQPIQRIESEFRSSMAGAEASRHIARLLEKVQRGKRRNELITAAALLLSLDHATALFLLRLDDRVAAATLAAARERTRLFFQNAGDGSAAQLLLALSSGALPGTTQDRDGLAAVAECPACCSQ
jgi:NAD(P)-dependent dehydrogenase (short-subunit alcohol dehydrogenase family)